MNVKKLALFGASAVIVAGGLLYALGGYPPASGRAGQGAIGKRQVYRAEQPADASVTPGAAPVAIEATAEQLKNQPAPKLQNGQIFQLNTGQLYQLNNGQMLALRNGQMLALRNGQLLAMKNGQMLALNNGQIQAMMKQP
jgi:hypothetical protein